MTKTGSRTSAVLMIEGSPYYRVVQVNGVDLPPAQEVAEQKRLASTIQRRQHETSDERAKRTAQYQKERHRDRELLEQLTEAMNFTFVGQEEVDSHPVDVFEALPRSDYVPKSMQMQVLPGMKGKLWIDPTSKRSLKTDPDQLEVLEMHVSRRSGDEVASGANTHLKPQKNVAPPFLLPFLPWPLLRDFKYQCATAALRSTTRSVRTVKSRIINSSPSLAVRRNLRASGCYGRTSPGGLTENPHPRVKTDGGQYDGKR
jgi:hypothetical protein